MRIGIACPYLWDVPGGVQFHIRDLAEEFIRRGHYVSVISPASEDAQLPDYLVSAGPALSIPYNGSVARLAFGVGVNKRVRAWLRDGNFDVIHVHEPSTPSVSMLALMNATCPVVSTFHTATDRSRIFEMSSRLLTPMLDKIAARIAVSQEARRTAVQHIGGDAWIIPNGVYCRDFQVEAKDPRFVGTPERPTLGFLGRLDEPRKGLPQVAAAFDAIRQAHPGVRLFVAGKGDVDAARASFGSNADAVTFLGGVSDEEKAALLASVDIYLAPNTGGESFGIILVEAMAAGGFIVASDIPAFRAVLGDGAFGDHFTNEDPQDLASVVTNALNNPQHRSEIAAAAQEEAWRYDWGTVASHIFSVYEAAIATHGVNLGEEPR